MAEKCAGDVGGHAACEDYGYVFHEPAVCCDVVPSVDVFGAVYGDGAANGFECRATIHGIAADADGGTPSVAAGLHDAEHVFLDGAGALLGPGLIA